MIAAPPAALAQPSRGDTAAPAADVKAAAPASVLDPRALARVLGILVALVAAVAVIVSAVAAAPMRDWLHAGFGGVPHRLSEVASLFLNNARLVVGVQLAGGFWQWRLYERRRAADSGVGEMLAVMTCGVDIVIGALVVINVAPIGLAFGAYGWRMVPALLPHGPFETMACVVALNVFLCSRRRLLSRREWLAAASLSVVLLAFAAVLETYLWVG